MLTIALAFVVFIIAKSVMTAVAATKATAHVAKTAVKVAKNHHLPAMREVVVDSARRGAAEAYDFSYVWANTRKEDAA